MKRLSYMIVTAGVFAAAGLAFAVFSGGTASAQTTTVPAGCVAVRVPKSTGGLSLITTSAGPTRAGAIFKNQGPASISLSGGIGLNAGEQRVVVYGNVGSATAPGAISAKNSNATADATVLVCNPF